jgi:coenzyme PQQ precursor peptide PqqA
MWCLSTRARRFGAGRLDRGIKVFVAGNSHSQFQFLNGSAAANPEENKMAWKTPKIVEVPVGMEINMYACAARK